MTSDRPVEEVSKGASLKKVTVSPNGPYVVESAIPLALQTIMSDSEGGSREWRQGRVFVAGESRQTLEGVGGRCQGRRHTLPVIVGDA